MFSREQGPEWVLSAFGSTNPEIQSEISQLTVVARRLWPRVRAYAISEQFQKNPDDAISTATDVWEDVLHSVAKTILRSNGGGSQVRDLDAYLFGVFHHRFNRALKKERKRAEIFRHVESGSDLESLRQGNDSKAARGIEQSILVKEAIQNMDEWTRKVWIARQ
jgi:DNA-directed RNA polymerase specialized sigma24 family protein